MVIFNSSCHAPWSSPSFCRFGREAKSGMGKTAVFVLACLQQVDSSEKAGISEDVGMWQWIYSQYETAPNETSRNHSLDIGIYIFFDHKWWCFNRGVLEPNSMAFSFGVTSRTDGPLSLFFGVGTDLSWVCAAILTGERSGSFHSQGILKEFSRNSGSSSSFFIWF